MDEKCRITVVGERRQVDLTVPAGAPIMTYVHTLARMCEQNDSDVMPSAWTLATLVGGPIAPEWSLAELGIVDGQVFYLRDVIADEYADPVVHDVGERVAEVTAEALDTPWNDRTRTVTVLLSGLAWLVATLLVLAVLLQLSAGVLADAGLAVGLVLPALAWVAGERGWPIPARLRTAIALCAVPVLAIAAWMPATGYDGGQSGGGHGSVTEAGLTAAALTTGSLVGALLAMVAAPGVATSGVSLAALVAAVLGIGLGLLRADLTESAGVVAVVAFWLLTIVPRTVSGLVAFAHRRAEMRAPVEPDGLVEAAVRHATRLLIVWNGALCAVLALALVALAAAPSWYAGAAVGCLGLGLLLRAGAGQLAAEVVPVAFASAAGLFTLVILGPDRLGWGGWVAPTSAFVIAAALLIYGFRRLMRRPGLPSMARPRWLTPAGSVLGGAGVTLVVALFGAFGHFVQLGHHV
ncbi:EsaB/YukD family protein [Streptomyces sp. NBC_01476]|uniref:EsaB/YukD family protein n=1 Tax=Streptomyces sp. NBC_01476 TaxID=2903881 RepID=UPI002E3256E6|nr:EsaB/YukD family protein [Streptomyces sp. NBC_01476]